MGNLLGGSRSGPLFGPGSPTFDPTNPNLGGMTRLPITPFQSQMESGSLFGPGSSLFDITNPQLNQQRALLSPQDSITAATRPSLPHPDSMDNMASLNLRPDVNNRLNQIIQAAKNTWGENSTMAQLAASQATLESRLLGKPSSLATKHNNLFGIKGSGTADSVTMTTQEFINGRAQTLPQRFAKNKTLADSFVQHKQLLSNPRYQNVLQASSFEEAAKAVKAAGYATDPHYSTSLINIYNKYLKDRF